MYFPFAKKALCEIECPMKCYKLLKIIFMKFGERERIDTYLSDVRVNYSNTCLYLL